MKKNIFHKGINSSIVLLLLSAITITACKKNKPEPAEDEDHDHTHSTGSMSLYFESVVGSDSLALNTGTYINQNNDTFTVSKFDYYISNIKFINTSGGNYSEVESYHLIKSNDASTQLFTINNVPVGNYNQIVLTIGIDSTRNVSGAQTGALDPVHGMFWSWSSGYIMAKLEGNSPQAPSGNFEFHIGGYYGANSAVKTITLPFPIVANVDGHTIPEVHLKTDLLEFFKSPTTINFATMPVVTMPGTNAGIIANNYTDMISVDHIHQ